MNALLEYLQAFGGRARELATEPQNYLAGLLSSLPDRNNLQGAVQDPEFYKGLLSNTKEVAGGLLTGAVGAPVDIATMMMRPGGYSVPDKSVVGSSNHLAGLLGLDAESTPYKVGSLLPTDPGDAMKYAGLLGVAAKADGVANARPVAKELDGHQRAHIAATENFDRVVNGDLAKAPTRDVYRAFSHAGQVLSNLYKAAQRGEPVNKQLISAMESERDALKAEWLTRPDRF